MAKTLSEEDIDSIAQRVVRLIGEKLTAMPSACAPPQNAGPGEKLDRTIQSRLAYTKKELCAEIGLSPTTIWRLELLGRIKPVPGMKHKIYSRAEVMRFLAGERSK